MIVTSGLAAWFFEAPRTIGVGASGVVFGYFGYIMVRGLFDRRAVDVLIGAVMALCFAYQFSVLLPHQGIGWQAHVGGLVGGIAAGWLFKDSRAVRTARQKQARLGCGQQQRRDRRNSRLAHDSERPDASGRAGRQERQERQEGHGRPG